MSNERVFQLSEEDYEALLLLLGYACATAHEQNNRLLARRFLRLANTINKDNPQWTPYEIAEEP